MSASKGLVFFLPVKYLRNYNKTVSNKSCVTFAMDDLAHILSCFPIFKPLRIKTKAPMKTWKCPISETDIQGRKQLSALLFFPLCQHILCQVYSRGSASNGKLFCISPSSSLPLSLLVPPYPLSSFSRSPPLFPSLRGGSSMVYSGLRFQSRGFIFYFYWLWRREGESCFCNHNCTKQWWRLDKNGKHLIHSFTLL